ncbi:MAG: exodeoxyribonuclease VII small subunit [Bacteroidota bacterium]
MAKGKKTAPTYESAMQELEDIVQWLQQPLVEIDALTEKSKRAATLIRFCREKLRTAETELDALFEEEND